MPSVQPLTSETAPADGSGAGEFVPGLRSEAFAEDLSGYVTARPRPRRRWVWRSWLRRLRRWIRRHNPAPRSPALEPATAAEPCSTSKDSASPGLAQTAWR